MGEKEIGRIGYIDNILDPKNTRLRVRCPRCKRYYDIDALPPPFQKNWNPPFLITCQDCKLVFKVNMVRFKPNINIEMIKKRWEDKDYQEKMKKALNRKPNEFEAKFFERMISHIPNLRYVGDFSFFVGRKNPDFILEGTNKCIDLFGEYWHRVPNEEEERKEYFKEMGFELVIIWEFEWKKDNQKCIDSVIQFVS